MPILTKFSPLAPKSSTELCLIAPQAKILKLCAPQVKNFWGRFSDGGDFLRSGGGGEFSKKFARLCNYPA